ncbi:ComEC/Rec2 family competence protein [Rapidithrix thailandica]|uniref:ComEC/Rec2 family competence protein n=1 Tax=Rapidithrix thailandica TaxID=413964 RepID=A0AAW9RSG7_9BACT
MKWAPYVFVRYVGYLIIGILSYIHIHSKFAYALELLLAFVLMYTFCRIVFPRRWQRKQAWVFGLLAAMALVAGGYSLTHWHTACHSPGHFAHKLQTITHYQAVLDSEVEEKNKSWKCVLKVKAVKTGGQWQKAKGSVLAYIAKQDSSNSWQYGDVLLVQGTPVEVSPPLNPHQFDYKKYLAYHSIYHQHFLKPHETVVLLGNTPHHRLLAHSYRLRTYFQKKFAQQFSSESAAGVATALVFGIKEGLDQDTQQAYASAGAMHVLAVSGLHVGIIFFVVNFLFGKCKSTPWGAVLFAFISLSLLWGYAFITGLSASVLRAVTMFTFVIVGQSLHRRSNIYNTLAVSAFVLLCFQPYLIVQVGFQLSYIAVVGIVYLQPKLVGLWKTERPVWRWIWEISTVSIAAQIATAPLSLLYFHQFPTYFLFSNLVVIPAAMLIVCLGLLAVSVSFLPWLFSGSIWVLEAVIALLNFFVKIIQQLPGSTISEIHISVEETWVVYASILSLVLLFALRKFSYVVWGALLITCLGSFQMLEWHDQFSQKVFTVYHTPRQTTLCFMAGTEAWLIGEADLLKDPEQCRYLFYQDWYAKGIQKKHYICWNQLEEAAFPLAVQTHAQQLISWEGKTFLILRKPLQQPMQEKVDFLVVSRKAVRDLTWVNCDTLILDTSISHTRRKFLLDQAQELNIFVYDINTQGAFVKHFLPEK